MVINGYVCHVFVPCFSSAEFPGFVMAPAGMTHEFPSWQASFPPSFIATILPLGRNLMAKLVNVLVNVGKKGVQNIDHGISTDQAVFTFWSLPPWLQSQPSRNVSIERKDSVGSGHNRSLGHVSKRKNGDFNCDFLTPLESWNFKNEQDREGHSPYLEFFFVFLSPCHCPSKRLKQVHHHRGAWHLPIGLGAQKWLRLIPGHITISAVEYDSTSNWRWIF